MITLAFIGKPYAEQVATNPQQLSGVEVVYCGEDLLRGEATRPRVLVLELENLGADPRGRVEDLLARGVERIVVAYTYARRDLIQSLQQPRVHVVQGPLSLSNLRALLTDLLIKDILADSARSAAEPHEPAPQCPECGALLTA